MQEIKRYSYSYYKVEAWYARSPLPPSLFWIQTQTQHLITTKNHVLLFSAKHSATSSELCFVILQCFSMGSSVPNEPPPTTEKLSFHVPVLHCGKRGKVHILVYIIKWRIKRLEKIPKIT